MGLKMLKNIILIVIMISATTGCASIINGRTQSVAINPRTEGKIDRTAHCTVSNKKGTWQVDGGGRVIVRRNNSNLHVYCADPATQASGTAVGKWTTQIRWLPADFFMFDLCTISCLIDASTGAVFAYPDQIWVEMPITASPHGQSPPAPLP